MSACNEATVLSPADLEKIWSWNKYLSPICDSTMHALIETKLKAQPTAIALCTTWQGEMSYRELDDLSANLAAHLLQSSIPSMTGDRKQPILIPICFEKSIWAVVAMLGVLRAGQAFVPIDPKQPQTWREAAILRTHADYVLSSEDCAPLVAVMGRKVVVVDQLLANELARKNSEHGSLNRLLLPAMDPHSTAYIIFTSGSTGEPKGVVVNHKTASTSCLALGARLGVVPGTRVIQFSAYTFDGSIFEIFGTLILGGVVCIPSEDERLNKLSHVINSLKVDVFAPLTPTVAQSISASEVPYLSTLGLGGEAVSQADIDRWIDLPRLLNVYGPTETCIICIAHDIRPDEADGMVLGKGFASATWVVDPYDHNVLAPLGQEGELLIEGILADGYLDRPDLTLSTFISDPPWLVAGSAFHEGRRGKVYKTGDIVRYDDSGRLVFIGRKDTQVKIRGQRIELSDVEHHVRECLSVSAVVADIIVDGPREILAAFIVGMEDSGATGNDKTHPSNRNGVRQITLSTQQVSALKENLPEPMIPSFFCCMRQLPMTSSGKLDRKLMRELGSEAVTQTVSESSPSSLSEEEDISYQEIQDLDRVWQLNHNPAPKPPGTDICLHHLFERQAELNADSAAICGWDGNFTYQELDRISSLLAAHLVALGVRPETVVPLVFATSCWAVVAILAVLKAGGAFAGIDERQLPDRRNEMIKRVKANVVLVSEDFASTTTIEAANVVTVGPKLIDSLLGARGVTKPKEKEIFDAGSNSACYVIFTSGTTGSPKGVITEHGAICTSVMAHVKRMGATKRSRILQFSICSFDACIMEIFIALVSGGVVCIPSTEERMGGGLEGAITRMDANFFIVTPSVSRIVKAAIGRRSSSDQDSVTVALVGEAAGPLDISGWKKSVRLLNGYGPTECSAGCVMHDFPQGASLVGTVEETRVIGKAVGCITWVVDLHDNTKLAPFGADGELFIEGSILARGYLDDHQTSSAFITDPPWLCQGTPNHRGRCGRVYKTGDVVRYTPDGSILYVGRRDSQVKLRGQRLDLGDIERHLQFLVPHARAIVVEMVTILNSTDSVTAKLQAQPREVLAALFQMNHGNPTEGRSKNHKGISKEESPAIWPLQLSADQLSQVAERLPQFMTPSLFLGISGIPTTSAGKTDRRRLRQLVSLLPMDQLIAGKTLTEAKRPPSTELEHRLHQLWVRILGLDPSHIGVDCDFFRLGGDSLTAMHLCSMARKAGLIISSRDILTRRTIASLALAVRVNPSLTCDDRSWGVLNEGDPVDVHFQLSPIQKLYFDVNDQKNTHFDQNYLLEIKNSQVTRESLEAALKAVVSLHSMLRARFIQVGGTWLPKIAATIEDSYTLFVVPASESGGNEYMEASITTARESLNISTGPILSAVLFEGHTQRLFVTISHLSVDLVSWRIILADLEEYLTTGKISTPPQVSFQSWCKHQAAQISPDCLPVSVMSQPSDVPKPSLAYWGLDGRNQDLEHAWSTTSFSLNTHDTLKFLTSSNESLGTKPAMLLCAALIYSFSRVFTDRDLPTIFQEGHGRELWDSEWDISRTVGWFTTVFAVPVQLSTAYRDVSGSDGLVDAIRRVKDATSLARRGQLDFTIQSLASQWPVEIMLNYTGSSLPVSTERHANLFSPLPMPDTIDRLNKTRLSALIQIEAAVTMGQLQVDVHHNANMQRGEEISRWARLFETTLKDVLIVLEGRPREWSLSDFAGTFSTYGDLARFRDETLPKLAIQAHDVEDVFPLTPLQHGIYTGQLKNPTAYMLVFVFECLAHDSSSAVISDQLYKAWGAVVERHPLLRAVLLDSLPGFVVLGKPEVAINVDGNRIVIREGRKTKLLHNLIIRTQGTGTMSCRLEISHLIFDAHSKSLILRDLKAAMANISMPPAPSFRIFASHLKDNTGNTVEYWKTYLKGVEPCLIPTGSSRLEGGGTDQQNAREVRVETQPIPSMPWVPIKDFCRNHGATTPANILNLAWGWVLRGYTGLSTVCFHHLVSSRGSPLADADTNEILGPMFDNLPLRIDFRDSDTILTTTMSLHQAALEGLAHQNTSLASIHHELDLGAGRLSNTCVVMEMSSGEAGALPDEIDRPLVIREVSGYDPTDFDILVSASVADDELQINVNYQAGLVSPDDALHVGMTLRHALLWIVHNPTSTWEEASLISPVHEAQIKAWNTPVPEATHIRLHQLVEAQADLHPDAPAICSWDGNMTAQELNIAADMVAGLLQERYLVQAGTLVPMIMEKSKFAMIAMLAILKAGGAFVPIATEPPSRMDRVLAQLPEVGPVISSKIHAELVRPRATGNRKMLVVDQDLIDRLKNAPLNPTSSWANPNTAAYVIFTSGTTGDPKGVVIEHSSISTAILSQSRAFGYGPATRSYQFTAYTFDASITEIFATLCSAGCLCIPSESDRLDLSGTAKSIEKMKANTCFFTPTVARLLQPSQLPMVTTLILGGEAVDAGLIAMWKHVPRVFCLYGPSEASICCASYEVRRGTKGKEDVVDFEVLGAVGCQIGEALGSVSWIVDRHDHRRLAPFGAFGELLVMGPIVGKGYLNDPAKTNSVFITDPPWLPQDSRPSRIYKTGDLVRYLSDGTLLFQGRIDSQIKINGQRIELFEIEFHVRSVMAEAASVVAEVVTLPHGGTREDGQGPERGAKKLVVFLGMDDMTKSIGNIDYSHLYDGGGDGEARSFIRPIPVLPETFSELERKLPVYMVPSMFFAMPKNKIPTLASGKTDRKQLRHLVSSNFSLSTLAQVQHLANNIKRQPCTDLQRRLQTVWAEVLNQDPKSIGLDDTFFRLGGNSLTGMSLVRLASKKFGIEILFSHLIKGTTLDELAAVAKYTKAVEEQDSIEPFSLLDVPVGEINSLREDIAATLELDKAQVEDCFPCTPLQEGLVSLTAQVPGAYIIRHVFSLSKDLDLALFRAAWQIAIEAAPILRTRIIYSRETKGFVQVVIREKIDWVYKEGIVADFLAKDEGISMGLGTRLTHYAIVSEGQSSCFLWTVHHALYDGFSFPLIMDLVARAYHNLELVQPQPYQTFVKHIKHLDSAVIRSWWITYLSNLEAVHFPRTPENDEKGRVSSGAIERRIAKPIVTGGTMASSTIIHTAWAIVVSKLTRSNDVVFGAMFSGRHHAEGAERIIGPTMALVPVRIVIQPSQTVSQLLQAVQNQAAEMTRVEQVGIQSLARINSDTRQACGFQTLLAVQPAAEYLTDIPAAEGLWEWHTKPIDRGLREYGLTLQVIIPKDSSRGFVVQANFDREVVSDLVMSTAIEQFVRVLEQLCVLENGRLGNKLVGDIKCDIDSGPLTAEHNRPPTTITGAGPFPQSPYSDKTVSKFSKSLDNEAAQLEHQHRPTSLVERLLQQLWAEVLDIEPNLIGVNDSFVRLGGDSVLAMQLCSLARDYDLPIAPRDLLIQSKTIASLAVLIGQKRREKKTEGAIINQQPVSASASNNHNSNQSLSCELPLAFKTRSDLDEFQTRVLPKLGVAAGEVEDVIPCSPLQEGILLSQILQPKAYWNSLVFDVSSCSTKAGRLNPEKLQQAWSMVVQRHAMLRAVLVESLPGNSRPGLIILKSTSASISRHRVANSTTDPACMNIQWFQQLQHISAAAPDHNSRLQHHLTICEVYDDNDQNIVRLVLCLHFNHIILDGFSQFLVLNDLRAAYTGNLDLSPAESYSRFIAYTQDTPQAEALGYWKNYMESAESCVLLGDQEQHVESKTDTLSVCQISKDLVMAFHRQSDATTATLVQAAWALTLVRHTSQASICFAYGVSGRGAPVPGMAEMVGPVISLLLCQVRLEDLESTTAQELLNVIGSDNQDSLVHQHGASLATLLNELGYDGKRNRLFNTAVNLQTPAPVRDQQQYDIEIIPRETYDTTEFDVTLSSIDSQGGLDVTMSYKSGYLSACFAAEVAETLAEAITWIMQKLEMPLSAAHIWAESGQDLGLISYELKNQSQKSRRSDVSDSTTAPIVLAAGTTPEQQLKRLFCRALNMPEVQIGVRDDFFRLGGDSVAAIQISAWARSHGIDISVRDIMTKRTIAELACLVPQNTALIPEISTATTVTTSFPLAPVQALYFHIQKDQRDQDACLAGADQCVFLRLAKAFSLSQIASAIKELVHLHPMLRARFDCDGARCWTQRITADAEGSHRVRRVTLPEDPKDSAKALACAITRARDELDASAGPVLSAVLFEGGGCSQKMFIAIHHLVVDLVSWRIFLHDLEVFLTTGRATVRPTMSYQMWCQSLAATAEPQATNLDAAALFPSNLRPSQLPYWGVGEHQNTMADMISHDITLDAELTAKLLSPDSCNTAFGTNLPALLIAALIYSFRRVFNDRDEPVIWNERIGRDPIENQEEIRLDPSGTVGWFTSLTPVQIDGHRGADMADVLRRVKDCIMTVPPHGWHTWLAARIASGQGLSQWPAEIIFNYLGLFQQLERPESLFALETSQPYMPSSRDDQVRQFSIFDVTAGVEAGNCCITFRYNRHVRNKSQVKAWIREYQDTIETIIRQQEEKTETAPQWTLSDFPGVFSHYNHVEEFQQHTLPVVLNISQSLVEDVLPLSPLQQGIFLSQIKDADRYRTAILLEISATTAMPVDSKKLIQAWQAVVDKHSLLRAVLLESLPGSSQPAFVVLKSADASVRCLDKADTVDHYRKVEWWRQYYNPVHLHNTGLQHHLVLIEDSGIIYCCLEVNHMVVDSVSTAVILKDWQLAYAGALEPHISPYRDLGFLPSDSHSNGDRQLQYWHDQLQGMQPCLLPGTFGYDSKPGSQHHARSVATCSMPSIRSFCHDHGLTVANVMQMAWSLTLHALTGQSTVVFGHAVSSKQGTSMQNVVRPTMSLLPCRVHISGGSDTLLQAMQRIRDDLIQDLPNQGVALASITHILGVDRLFNTALTVQAPVVQHHNETSEPECHGGSGLQIRQIGGFDPSEFDVTINAIDDGQRLDIYVIYRDSDPLRGDQSANRLAGILHEVLSGTIESGGTESRLTASVVDEILNSQDNLPVRFDKNQARQVEQQLDTSTSDPGVTDTPLNDMERRLQQICAKVVGLDPDQVSSQDNFFSLGGDSAAAMQLASEAYRAGVAITVRQVMLSTTLAELAKLASLSWARMPDDYQPFSLIDASQRELVLAEVVAATGNPVLDVQDILPATDMQAYCIEMGTKLPSLALNNIYFDLKENPDTACLETACRSVVEHFSLLRTLFLRHHGSIWQVVLAEKVARNRPVLRMYDVNETDSFEQSLAAVCAEDEEGASRLSSSPATFILFKKTERDTSSETGSRDKYRFVLRLSHAQYDGVTLSLIIKGLANAYAGRSLNPIVSFGSFLSYAAQQKQNAYAFWRRRLQGATMTEILPTLRLRNRVTATGTLPTASCSRVFETVSRVLTIPPGHLLRFTAATLIEASWAVVLSHLAQRRDIVFGHVVGGRNARLPCIEDMCGPTSNILPLRIRLADAWTAESLVRHVHEQCVSVGEFDAPLGLWREVLQDIGSDGQYERTSDQEFGREDLGFFPFETVLLHRNNDEQQKLACPFGKGTAARAALLEGQATPPYVCLKSRSRIVVTRSSTGEKGIDTRGRQLELCLEVQAPAALLDSKTAAWAMEMLAGVVEALVSNPKLTVAEMKDALVNSEHEY